MKKLNGSQMISEALKHEGVSVVFGYPGGAALNIYDETYKQNYFTHILTRHEQAAVHAADGYARATGKVGVAFVTSGPGFTNAVTGLATAYADSIPLVLISGQVALPLIGTDAFQEIDAVGISRPCVKHNFLVKTVDELPLVLKQAFYIARSGRPGPVHVDIPKDVTAAIGEFKYPDEIKMQTYKPNTKGHPNQIKKACDAIAKSKKPIAYIGGGAISSNSSDEIRKFLSKTKIPAVETLMALGVLRSDDDLNLGMVGMHGSYAANMALSEADLIICLGARFDDRVTGKLSEFGKNAKVIHVDIDPSSIGKIVNAEFPIVGDLKNVMIELNSKIDLDPANFASWRDQIKIYENLHPLGFKDSDEVLKPQWVIQNIASIVGNDAIIATDVGQHQMWVAQFYPFNHPRQLLTSGGLGTMGFGLPSAMGAAFGSDKPVIAVSGDGGFLMNVQELMTLSANKKRVINIVLNNNFLGMVRQWQTFFYGGRYSNTDLELQPDFVKVCEGFGGIGFSVETKDEFKKALQTALKSDTVSVIEVKIDRFENVLPMVPAGAAIYNMILE
ncbi:acetolactate synthase large subunit [Campylobacter hyointestinalis subsp. hyointestinalis]|uniref:Acetolactate synthase n=1 Tax=Campylobacter hyointestinalis subsp. hyointestinalis TaxID=91352 RepID=A0A2S5J6J5_CAMHY|nr:acetolactate synthase large subunit [Campylobacter hyointestinalis]PPB56075.1 acetolactate synthase, large subunit, biosynthetic type [Campylobacter hyointestinalis subsp. hyointestinalis]PPB59178.1 acetolactate synthase, large subunit, biosynthetic type [Campylobacter hyointestinalis subsp. hyointestinalis]QCT99811.1 acetolactate synthase large subunit [Campylobacter hyointestinalis subsp. hyointestinalis]TWO18846.1 acetolactate synthase large subunit [Campylobacter hyointestinalis]CUU7041